MDYVASALAGAGRRQLTQVILKLVQLRGLRLDGLRRRGDTQTSVNQQGSTDQRTRKATVILRTQRLPRLLIALEDLTTNTCPTCVGRTTPAGLWARKLEPEGDKPGGHSRTDSELQCFAGKKGAYLSAIGNSEAVMSLASPRNGRGEHPWPR